MSKRSLCNVALTLLCAFVLVGSASAVASDGFRIEDYIPEKFTDLEWKINGNVKFGGTDNESDNGPSVGNNLKYDSNQETSTGRLSLGSQLTYRYETVARTLELGGDGGFSYSTSDRDNSSISTDSLGPRSRSKSHGEAKTYGFNLAPFFEARSYLIADLFAGASGSASIRHTDVHQNDVTPESFSRHDHSDLIHYNEVSGTRDQELDYRDRTAALALQTGWGRLYEGRYAATALYMIDELKQGGLLERGPSKDEMLELTEIIYQNRMAHEVDHRVAKMDALNAVLEYLTQNGMITETDHLGYLLIQDVYDNFPRTSRRFGAIVRLGLGWEYNFNKLERSVESDIVRLSYQHHPDSANVVDTTQNSRTFTSDEYNTFSELDNTFLNLGVEYHRPVSTRWQLDASADLSYYLHAEGLRIRNLTRIRNRPSEVRLSYRKGMDDYYHITFDCVGTWIYNSRTNLSSAVIFSYDHYQHINDVGVDQLQTNKNWDLRLMNSLTYRISIPTSLGVGLSYNALSYKVTDESDTKRTTDQWNLSASISHYLY